MSRLTAVIVLLSCAFSLPARDVLRTFPWSSVSFAVEMRAQSEVLAPDDAHPTERLRIVNDSDAPRQLQIFSVVNPQILQSVYALEFQVRCEGVEGEGYLEMWSYFDNGRSFFSRTLSTDGPMRTLSGTQDWRPASLPFILADSPLRPNQISVNLYLPGRGIVELTPMSLVEFAGGEDPLTSSAAWWSSGRGGLFGGIAGSVGGVLGALIGFLASRGKGRRLAIAILWAFVGFGAGALALGLLALWSEQPYAVWYPLVLTGGLFCVLGLVLMPQVRRQFAQRELQRMRALDAH